MEEIEFEITAEDVAQAEHARLTDAGYWASKDCPTAQALQRRFPDERVRIGCTACYIADAFYNMPEDLQQAIVAWDQRSPFSTGRYRITR